MRNGAVLTYGAIMDDCVIKKKPEIPKEPRIETEGNSTKIIFQEIIRLSCSVKLRSAFKEEVDENEIKRTLALIQNLDTKSTQRDNQLKKALIAYRSAVSSFDRGIIFKNLFNALELATNSDGIDRAGDKLSREIVAITNEKINSVTKWRKFNARNKHIDLRQEHERSYEDGMKNMASWILPLRLATQITILARL